MALVIADRVRETTNSTGTGTITLAGPYSGFQAFSVLGTGNTTYYAIVDPTTGSWEVGIGTYTSAGNTLSRDTVLSSSNAGALVPFAAGLKDAICTQPSERNVYVVGSNVVAENSATVPNSLLANSAVTLGSTSVSLGATASTISGLTSIAATDVQATNIDALDGTAAFSIANTTGVVSIDDTKFTLQDNSDTSKKALFELSGITTATTRTYTLPNLTGSLATIGTLTQTFTGTTTFSAGTVTVGSSTGTSTLGLGTGATTNGTTKTINIGTAGVSGSITNINVGSAVSGATGTLTINDFTTWSTVDAIKIPVGTTGERPAGASGYLRFNSTTTEFEGYNGTAWASVGGSAISNDTSTATNLYPLFANATTGTAANVYTSNAQYLFKPSTGELSVKAPRASNGILINSATVSSDYTIAAGDNGLSSGPVSVNSGITVTVSSGSVWTVV
jgi:hypothetical protein